MNLDPTEEALIVKAPEYVRQQAAKWLAIAKRIPMPETIKVYEIRQTTPKSTRYQERALHGSMVIIDGNRWSVWDVRGANQLQIYVGFGGTPHAQEWAQNRGFDLREITIDDPLHWAATRALGLVDGM